VERCVSVKLFTLALHVKQEKIENERKKMPKHANFD
jgi:hypothetical protein